MQKLFLYLSVHVEDVLYLQLNKENLLWVERIHLSQMQTIVSPDFICQSAPKFWQFDKGFLRLLGGLLAVCK